MPIRPQNIIRAKTAAPVHVSINSPVTMWLGLVLVTMRRLSYALSYNDLNVTVHNAAGDRDTFGTQTGAVGNRILDFTVFLTTVLSSSSNASGIVIALGNTSTTDERMEYAASIIRDYDRLDNNGNTTGIKAAVDPAMNDVQAEYKRLVEASGFDYESVSIDLGAAKAVLNSNPFARIKDPILAAASREWLSQALSTVSVKRMNATNEADSTSEGEVHLLANAMNALDGWRWTNLISDGDLSTTSLASDDNGVMAMSFLGFFFKWFEDNAKPISKLMMDFQKAYHSMRDAAPFSTYVTVFKNVLLADMVTGVNGVKHVSDPIGNIVDLGEKTAPGKGSTTRKAATTVFRAWFAEIAALFILNGAAKHGLVPEPTMAGTLVTNVNAMYVAYHTPRMLPTMQDIAHVYGMASYLDAEIWIDMFYTNLPPPATFKAIGDDKKENKRYTWPELVDGIASCMAKDRLEKQHTSVSGQIASFVYDIGALTYLPALAWAACSTGGFQGLTAASSEYNHFMQFADVQKALTGPNGLGALFTTTINFALIASRYDAAVRESGFYTSPSTRADRLLNLLPVTFSNICVSVHAVVDYVVRNSGMFVISHRSELANFFKLYRNRTESNAPGTVIIVRNTAPIDALSNSSAPVFQGVPIGEHSAMVPSMASWLRIEKDEKAAERLKPLHLFTSTLNAKYDSMPAILSVLGTQKRSAGTCFLFGEAFDGELLALALASDISMTFTGMSGDPEVVTPIEGGPSAATTPNSKGTDLHLQVNASMRKDFTLSGFSGVITFEGQLVTDTRGAASLTTSFLTIKNVVGDKYIFETTEWTRFLMYVALEETHIAGEGPLSSKWYLTGKGKDYFKRGVDPASVEGRVVDARSAYTLLSPAGNTIFQLPEFADSDAISGALTTERALKGRSANMTKVVASVPICATLVVRSAHSVVASAEKHVFINNYAHDVGELVAGIAFDDSALKLRKTSSAPFGVFQGVVRNVNTVIKSRNGNELVYPLMPLLCEAVEVSASNAAIPSYEDLVARPCSYGSMRTDLGKVTGARSVKFRADAASKFYVVTQAAVTAKGARAIDWPSFNKAKLALASGSPASHSAAAYFVINLSPYDSFVPSHDKRDYMRIIDLDGQLASYFADNEFRAMLSMIRAMRARLPPSVSQANAGIWLPDLFMTSLDARNDILDNASISSELTDRVSNVAAFDLPFVPKVHSFTVNADVSTASTQDFETAVGTYVEAWVDSADGGDSFGLAASLYMLESSLTEWCLKQVYAICNHATVRFFARQFESICGVRLVYLDTAEARLDLISWRLSTAIWLTDHVDTRRYNSRLLRVLANTPHIVARLAARLTVNDWD